MQIYHDIRTAAVAGPTVLTIGNFDGLHRGHQALLATVRARANEFGPAGQAALLTFSPHPLAVLRPEYPHQILTTPEERMQLAAAAGIDFGIIQPFNAEVAAFTAQTFLTLLKTHCGLAGLIVGPDFALGRNREGDLARLQELGQEMDFFLDVMTPIDWENRPVRSSIIRHKLREGDVEEARRLLGRAYAVTGQVESGDKRGRQIGVPTANIATPAEFLLPGDGVYATMVHVLDGQAVGRYESVTNIGVRPTVDGLHHRVEAHLLDYTPRQHNEELYGATVRLEFLAWLRGEKRFAGLDALTAQIRDDIAAARTIFGVYQS